MQSVIDEGTAKHVHGAAVDEPAVHALLDLAVHVLVVAAVLRPTQFLEGGIDDDGYECLGRNELCFLGFLLL